MMQLERQIFEIYLCVRFIVILHIESLVERFLSVDNSTS